MSILDIIIFNVDLGQCIFIYPQSFPEYGMMIDCGDTPEFNPIDQLLEWGLIPKNNGKFVLGNFTLTNYDQDHFSGLPHLTDTISVSTVSLSNNISSDELIEIKEEVTEPLEELINLKNTYTSPAPYHQPPYVKKLFSLRKEDFPDEEIDTNKLSQVVFVEYNGFTICVPGDITKPAWEKLLLKDDFRKSLEDTTVFVASHHGREDGYCSQVFDHCFPECIVFSDKDLVHGTQDGMASCYADEVNGDGIIFNGNAENKRYVLTTRNDGNIWIRVEANGSRKYASP